MLISKFEAAERQLLQAIDLFFQDGDPISVHTLTEAASQILYDLRGRYGVESIVRDSDWIRDEYKNEWKRHLARSKNFFKHADKDPDGVHKFDPRINDYALIDAVNLYSGITRKWVPETLVFSAWMALAHSNLIKEESDFAALIRNRTDIGMLPEEADKELMHMVLLRIRDGTYSIASLADPDSA